jgi:hypothetical protein
MAAGEVTFTTIGAPKLSVTCWLGADPPKVMGGYGGWEIVNRPRRTAVTQWRGREPIQMDVAIVLDGFKGDDSIEYDVIKLERMAQPYKTEPPQVKLIGSAVPHSDLDWVITNIDWGDAIRRKNGDRLRQEGTVSLVSHIDVDKVKITAAKRTRQKSGRK